MAVSTGSMAVPRRGPSQDHTDGPDAVGVLGLGALASAMVIALHRSWKAMRFHLSPRSAQNVADLQRRVSAVAQHSNQAVADACQMLIIGVRPAQLQTLADEVEFSAHHVLMVPSAGTSLVELQAQFAPARVTRLMTGLAVAAGRSAISCYPPDAQVKALWEPACTDVIAFDVEAHFDASVLAVCANAWWLDQLGVMSHWLVRSTGMQPAQAQALLAANMADVERMLAIHPDKSPAELASFIGSTGTYTAAGLGHLQAVRAQQPWVDALALVYAALPR